VWVPFGLIGLILDSVAIVSGADGRLIIIPSIYVILRNLRVLTSKKPLL
jgi:hypothetical protein